MESSPEMAWNDFIINPDMLLRFPKEMVEEVKRFYQNHGQRIESSLSIDGLEAIVEIHEGLANRENKSALKIFIAVLEKDRRETINPLSKFGNVAYQNLKHAGLEFVKKYALEGKWQDPGILFMYIPDVIKSIFKRTDLNPRAYSENVLRIFTEDVAAQAAEICLPLFCAVSALSEYFDSEALRKIVVELSRTYSTAKEKKAPDGKEESWNADYRAAAEYFAQVLPKYGSQLAGIKSENERYNTLKIRLQKMNADPKGFHRQMIDAFESVDPSEY
jgi:hypothetical protein